MDNNNNNNNNNNNYFSEFGLNSNGDDLFDFEAASTSTWTGMNYSSTSTPLWPTASYSQVQQPQPPATEEATHIMPLTKSEIDAILAVRALRNQASQFPSPILDTGLPALEQRGASAAFSDGAETRIAQGFNEDFGMPDYGNAPITGVWALADNSPVAGGQSG